jgi:hypothetical protein
MKSTIKIDTEQGQPILKIVQPIDCVNFTLQNDDYDVRDKLLSEFIQKPSMTDWNGWFRVNTHFTHPFENPTHQITTIAPVEVEELFNLFKHNILNRLVPYNTVIAINSGELKSKGKHAKIIEFFNWLSEQEWATWEEQHPYLSEQKPKLTKRKTIRDVFETRLSDEERIAAFDNTPRYKWDTGIESDYQALDVAFDFSTSPEGLEYWNKVLERLIPSPEEIYD